MNRNKKLASDFFFHLGVRSVRGISLRGDGGRQDILCNYSLVCVGTVTAKGVVRERTVLLMESNFCLRPGALIFCVRAVIGRALLL